jgi:methyl-accepting chemotaxis protein
MRAADAAKSTSQLIEGTIKRVKDGSDLVNRTNEAFQKVAESAAKVDELVSEISVASNEQAQGIEQVNKTVAVMDNVTQQVAANAEQSASASEEMNAQAVQLLEIVDNLKSLIKKDRQKIDDMDELPDEQDRLMDPPIAENLMAADGVESGIKSEPLMPQMKTDVEQVIPLDDDDFKDF